ncbi:histidine--tRNA ligase, chloroplastic/mitochondrial isoform X2 [Amborella trichopoda]|uniref:histidine--tRNA ligase, chloroplastic/mitochondrial isoform X2 n=1 Tax=Amborella trichopoda TaxID=13333 RepID=UPI0009BE2DEC|nr:histidine--tRNA ligase, chloroplastic/mitochondrial isoform X2 [Amborella trichopoda]|eukprot:XP_020518193.1 histidine--tRNA ligase, chloroplastic/mitochondrial isoform X2 [Amborella trichopoda]
MPTSASVLFCCPHLRLTLRLFNAFPFRFRSIRPLCASHASSFTSGDTAVYNSNSLDKGNSIAHKRHGGLEAFSSPTVENVAIDVNPPRGTRDFPPEEMRLRSWLFQNFREVSALFAFEEVDFPVLESEALFIRKAGEEISEQLYNFEDKGGRRVALRPELTPSLARLVIQKGKALPLPVKWFTIGQCWRYERTTRGRRREHYQWNMDIIGVQGVAAEAELIFSIVILFKRLGITSSDVGFKVSSRKVLQAVLQRYSIPEKLFGKVCIIIDKMDKIPKEEIEKELTMLGIPMEAINGLLQILSLKSVPELEEALGSDADAVDDLKDLFLLIEQYGCSNWIQFDASIVRGLAYYTGVVFELLKERGLLPELGPKVDYIVLPLDPQLQGAAAMVASTLREKGRSVDLVLENKRLKWVFKHAERINASKLILVGDSEWQRGMVRVKNLCSREESDLPLHELE